MSDFATMPLDRFLEQAASDAPTPGGGGIAALAGALGGAMAAMAANFTVGKPKFTEHDALMRETLAKLEPLIRDLRDALDGDAAAFSGISAAYRLPRNTDGEKAARGKAIQEALFASMQTPLAVLEKCREAAGLLPALAGAGNPNLLSDVEVAAIMLEAAAKAAEVNVLANARQLKGDAGPEATARAGVIVAEVARKAWETRETVQNRNA